MRALRVVGLLSVLASVTAACDARAPAPVGPAAPANPQTTPLVGDPPQAEKRPFFFRLDGSHPWNETVYYATGKDVDAGRPYTGAILDPNGEFVLEGVPDATFHVRSEVDPSPAELRMLWMVEARGKLGEGGTATRESPVTVDAPLRAHVVFDAPGGTAGPDAVTFFHEETGTCATAYRDPRHAFFLAIWDQEDGNAYRNVAPPRPWVIQDIAPGEYVIAARTEGRQWAAWRTELSAAVPFEIDSGNAPQGGGKVVCENANALLLLNGDLPVPSPRITTELVYRSTWSGVPPGKHAVRYPDGRVVEIDVIDGETLKLGR